MLEFKLNLCWFDLELLETCSFSEYLLRIALKLHLIFPTEVADAEKLLSLWFEANQVDIWAYYAHGDYPTFEGQRSIAKCFERKTYLLED